MIKSDPHLHSYGSAFDAVLHGVAQGLGSLFPPVAQPRPAEPDEEQSRDADDAAADPAQE
ncbi:hypothetical protein [Methylobacterium nigriterrae]|uniref:hypothetical protein n=1 Tax=Methylobacterium nigriterrae TaxID=3127512 RepID=UPI00301365BB